jgi:virginiamycin B lyase
MESRQLLATVAEFPVPTANGQPVGIVAGRDGNLWFAESNANKADAIDPATHATADFATPSPDSDPDGIAAGPDGNP